MKYMPYVTAAVAVLAFTFPITGADAARKAPKKTKPPIADVIKPAPANAPKLIVAISIDQFSADLFAEYRAQFTGGLKRLSGGVVFPSGYQSHAATETCPGHSTILTGGRPARTGIIANNWFDFSTARGDKKIYCAEDESIAGSSSEKYTVSDVHLKMPTLGDRLKTKDAKSRVVSVSGKDRAAVMMGGHKVDEIWWWGGNEFTSYAGRKTPAAVETANTVLDEMLSGEGKLAALPALCATKIHPYKLSEAFTVGNPLPARAAGDRRGFRASPDFDAAALAIASTLVTDMKLGAGSATDVLAIGLSATDYVGHTYGTAGPEMCQQLLALDIQLGTFFDGLDAAKLSYTVMLTADHGGHDLPERNKDHAIPDAARVDVAVAPSNIDAAVTKALGLDGFFVAGDAPFGDYYVARDIPADQRGAVIAEAKKKLLAHPHVAAVLTADDIAAAPKPTLPADALTLAQRAAANYDPTRSGDLYIILKPRITPIPNGGFGYVATHGSAWDYDRRVPILFWSKDLKPFEQPNAVETVDILPTLASLIGLNIPPAEIDGRCLDIMAGADSNCP